MKLYRKILTIVLLAVLVSALIPTPAFAADITVTTNQASYLPDQIVTISGTADADALVAIDVKNPLATSMFVDTVTATAGVYSTAFRLPVDAVLGTYTVYVSTTGSTDETTFIVTDVPGENIAPVADAGGPYSGEEGVAISFDGSGSTDSDGTIESYAWDFDDGGSATVESPSHTYTAAGTYTVTLTVTDDDDATDIDTADVTVTEADVPPDDDDDDDEPDVPPPTDDFSIDYVSADTADKGDVLIVIGSGVTAGTTVNVFWDYASGTYAHLLNTTEGNPDGTFECEITVPSDTVGDHYLWATDTSTGATVRSGPIEMVPKITLSPSSGLVEDEVTIKGYGFTAEANFTFTFGVESIAVSPTDVESDEDGYFTCTFEVPEDAVYGTYAVTAEDFYDFSDSADFILGASITLSVEEGPTGIVVEVEGRGWTEDATISFTLDGTAVLVVDEDVVTVDDEGLFSADIVIPDMATADEYEITATETGGVKGPATADFEVTGLPKITLSPGFGPPGAMIDISGYNFTQIKDTEVTLDFGNLEGIKTFKTDANGEFSGTFQAQAIAFSPPDHPVLATDEYGLSDDSDFRLGMMVIIISPISGPSGDFVYLTGTGFEPAGDWNATLGGELVAEGTATGEGTISDYFYAPTLDVGAHELVVLDVESEIELSTTFMITDTTRVTLDPADAPNGYNVTVEGYNFADKVGVLEFVLYNATDEWEIDVVTDPGTVAAVTDVDGNFTAYWIIPDEDTLSIGDYTINVTGSEDLFAQVSFSVAAELVDVEARKTLFNRGDVLQFDVSNDFMYLESYLKIWDPNDNLYWRTEALDTWLKVSGLYTVPYYTQTSGGNPMLLAADAPLGTWTWKFYSSGTTNITDGTFDVGPSPASILTGQIDELSDQITEITDRLGDVTDDLEDDIGDLAGDIANVVSEMETLRDDIVDDLADDIAAATDAGKAASDAVADLENSLSDLEDSVSDIADISNSALDAAQLAADAAADAASAAEDAGDAANGLTGLVYGAIGASLIAALAAIVSLMQISKKIAG